MVASVSTDEDVSPYSRGEAITLAWIPRLTGTLSAIGSLAIIYMILSNWEKKLAKPNHRLMLSMSILDVIQSIAFIMSSVALPGIGTDNTCIAQGFFMVIGLGVPILNTSLNIMYLLLIRYRVNQQQFAAKVEPFMHISSIVIPLVIATISVASDLIVPGPSTCYVSFEHNKILLVIGLLIGACFLISSYSLALVCVFIIRQIDRMKKYSYGSNQMRSMMTEKRETIIQVCLYTLAFLLTFSMPTILVIASSVSNRGHFFALEVMKAILLPLQGFWNFLFYIRLGIKKERKEFPDKCFIRIIFDIVFKENVPSDQTNDNVRTGLCLNTSSPKGLSLKMLSPKGLNPKKFLSNGKSNVGGDDNNKVIKQVGFEESETRIPVSDLGEDESCRPCKVGETKTTVLDFSIQKYHKKDLYNGSCHPPQPSSMVIDDVSDTGLDRSVVNQLSTLQRSDMTIMSNEVDLQEKTPDIEYQKENQDIEGGVFISKRRRSSLLILATSEVDYLFRDELQLVGEYDRCDKEV